MSKIQLLFVALGISLRDAGLFESVRIVAQELPECIKSGIRDFAFFPFTTLRKLDKTKMRVKKNPFFNFWNLELVTWPYMLLITSFHSKLTMLHFIPLNTSKKQQIWSFIQKKIYINIHVCTSHKMIHSQWIWKGCFEDIKAQKKNIRKYM